MHFYFYCRGFGFLWQVNSYDVSRCRMTLIRLCLYWKARMTEPTREWALYRADEGGVEYRETSRVRNGAWVLRGPWQKVA